jgi:hypothetical protein
MMNRVALRVIVIGLIGLLLGVFAAAVAFAFVPNPGSAPSVYDDFRWSSISNGFWHVNEDGGQAAIVNGILTMGGAQTELDHMIQTDPNKTVMVAKVRGLSFYKFAVGLGTYHGGTVSLEFDNDGFRCGRGTDNGWMVDDMKLWKTPPTRQWFYLWLSVFNPYPGVTNLPIKPKKPVTLTCAVYDTSGHRIAYDRPMVPPPNTRYPGIDEMYMRTWDVHNRYQVDWVYAGPASGDPLRRIISSTGR